ncbi:hypothetical protein ACFVOR_37155 [Streptomyces sp. NPDC057837]|uniref:hypothetical protein n=1 Tax=Streptomyces sp. NPDC057837 TaxID=3346260 RepID=UPI00368B17AA
MTMNQPDEFERIVRRINPNSAPEFTDPTPYGPPPHTTYTQPAKTGLTTRGKAAIGVGTAVIACGSLLGWQHYNAQETAAQTKAQELALKQQELRIQELRELNKANAAAKKDQDAENSERNKLVDECVASNKKMVGKLMGVTYQSVRGDCEAQYPTTTTVGDMQTAATAQDTTGNDGGGVSPGLLIGAGALGLGLVVFAKKSTKSHPA